MRKLFTLIVLIGITTACSQFSNSPTSKAWHNANAKYNSLLIARDNMKQAEKQLFDSREENYSALMTIQLPIDSMKSQAVKTNLDEVIKKTSLIAERHSNSRFLPEAYILLGKARLLKEDYLNSIEVFKYINTTSKSEDAKHSALIFLMRAYTEQKEYEDALKVAEILRNSDLNKKNTTDYYLTKAYFHQKREEFAISAAIAEEALKLMPKSEQKARVLFATAQMYEMIGKSEKALPLFKEVANNRPNYDMEFYAKMNALLDEATTKRGSTAGVQENFKRMLADRKNSDLKDKIFFTMGSLENKKGNQEKAIEYFNASLRNSAGNSNQKAYTYLELAELYYNQLQKYDLASLYYDSTLTALPQTSPDYERIARRAISLTDFVKYQKVLIVEDSLQKLAQMNPLALDKALENAIKQKEDEERKMKEFAEKLAAKAAEASRNSTFVSNEPDAKRWKLYDPLEIGRMKTEFIQIWGNRPLEDNWRRKDKDAGGFAFKVERGVVGQEKQDAPKLSQEEIAKLKEAEEAKKMEVKKKAIYEKLPTTPEKLIASQRKQEEAYYQIGKLYKFQFNEIENSKKAFTTLLDKFPNTVHESEVLYLLTLMSDNQQDSPYRKTLMAKYPASTYSRQLQRGNVVITQDTETQAATVYGQAFNMYSNESYTTALALAEEGLITYTGTTIEDKFAMLRIFLLAKNEQKDAYKQALTEFMQSYPSSTLLPKAKEMIAVLDKNK